MASKVYFTDMHASAGAPLPKKLEKLIDAAGLGTLDLAGKYVAIKTHFGEPGNLAFLRPNYAKVIVDYVKARGGRPFLTDCNTLYVGGRRNALDHMQAAYENGFSPFSTGCHIVIADGLRGTDEAVIPVDGDEVKEAHIGRAIADADVIISLSHFKGHVSTGFGGAIKNLGMGCGSRTGKMEMHSAGKPEIDTDLCLGCGLCATYCAQDAISYPEGKGYIDMDKCAGCSRCISICPVDAIDSRWDVESNTLNRKMVEYTKAVLAGKQSFHISLAIDISPCCDCHDYNDVPILPDVGMFASMDPVAIDSACADAVLPLSPLPGSAADCPGEGDHFHRVHPRTNWRSQIEHGVKMGLGSAEYELIRM